MRKLGWNARWASAAALMAVALVSSSAAAQEQTRAVDLPKFNPAPAGDRFFGVPSPYAAGEVTFHAAAMLDYAREPLVLVRESADSSEDVGTIVSDQMFVHVGVNFSLLDRIAISANMPIAVLSQGDGATGGTLNFGAPSGAAIGDLRLGLRLRLLGEYHDAFQLGVGGYVWVPTGADDSYVSDGSVRGQPQLLLGGRADRFIWSVMAGPTLRSESIQGFGPVNIGHQMNWGAGAGVLLLDDRILQLHVETAGGLDIESADSATTNAEVLGGVKLRIPGAEFIELGLGAGPGLTRGVGTPTFRGLFQAAYTPVIEEPEQDRDGDKIMDPVDACPDTPGVASEDPKKHGCPLPADRDKDGIIDAEDACPDVPGVKTGDPKTNGCPPPPPDRDQDGIVDDQDACPDVPGVKTDDPKTNGCPPDKDGDGIVDAQDACPELAGVKTDDPKTNGCPPDTDGDGFRDDQDACPKEKGVDDPDPTKRGCPKLVRVTEQEIVILEQVQFDTGKATIKPVSNPLLDSVAQVLKEHPEILKLEVQGHTDDRGSKQLNAKLSDDRAKSVREALIKRGVDGARLTAKGYGPDKPIADNKTDDGRQKNRRVQFVVQEKKASSTEVKTK